MKKFLIVFIILIFECLTFPQAVPAEPVMFNVQTQKVHKITCPHAKKCTKNCIKIERKDAYVQGGKPCKTCGG